MNTSNYLFIVAHQFNPVRLKIAREFRGLQKNELAEKLEITPSAITQFESGKARPNPKTIGSISMALGFPPTFFSLPGSFENISSDQFHFRSFRSSTQIERRKMVSASAIIGTLIDFIDEHVNLPQERITPSTNYRATTVEEIELAASKLRKDWGLGLGPIGNIINLLESNGVLVFRLLSDCKRVDAFSLWHQGRPLIFLNTEKGSASRSRFDAGHELGHLILHNEYLPGDRLQEEQANKFSSAFLLPRDSFYSECPRRLKWEHFLALKQRWKVSLPALIRRARDLELISEDTYRRAHIQINKNDWAYKEPFEPEIERPSILPKTMQMLGNIGWEFSAIAEKVGLRDNDLRLLTYADDVLMNIKQN